MCTIGRIWNRCTGFVAIYDNIHAYKLIALYIANAYIAPNAKHQRVLVPALCLVNTSIHSTVNAMRLERKVRDCAYRLVTERYVYMVRLYF